MSLKSFVAKIFAFVVRRKLYADHKIAAKLQEELLTSLIRDSSATTFGRDHGFSDIKNYEEYKSMVPVREYEDLKPYIELIKNGTPNVLWKGIPLYLSKTSGTTSGSKYIPITKESIDNHLNGARNALLCYIGETGKVDFVDGKMIFLQGSPELEQANGIQIGRLSGIVAHHVPNYLLKNRMPSYGVNCIDDWESKVEAIAEETLHEDMRLISGIPPWVQMYFEMLLNKSGKEKISDIFPNFSLLVYGGVNFKPYRRLIDTIIGKPVDAIEVYPASEGFIAFQDLQKGEGMLLNVNAGIFFEFVRTDQFNEERYERIALKDVELDVNYVLVVSSNAGLWAYNLGDTVKFTSLAPYRIIVSGRIKHFTSAFGEHVIAEEVEGAINQVASELNLDIAEFHVAPLVNAVEGELPRHQWYIEMNSTPKDVDEVAKKLDTYMQHRNTYYKDLRVGNILQELEIKLLKENAFQAYMKSIGKLGGQNKLPRLANDRLIADVLEKYLIVS
ncbi:MAG: GH3 auxin-responsive promoter family protein [Vicingaceae bacterium]